MSTQSWGWKKDFHR